jgi:ribonuclease J
MLEYLSSKDTFLMLAESKAVSSSGYCSPKHRTTHLIEEYFKEAEKRIFICSSWQNIYRVEEILKLCIQYKKKICLYDNAAKLILKEVLSVLPHLTNSIDVIDASEISRVRNQDVVILMLGLGNDLFQKVRTLSKGLNRDKRISLTPNDIYIVATLPLPMQETMATRAVDSLYRTGCEVVWIKKKDVTSMHAQQDDLKYLLSVFRPKYYLPVRGNYVSLMNNAKLALSMEIGLNHTNVFILDNGMVLDFPEVGRPRIIPNEQSGIDISPVLVDGKGLIGLDTGVIEERITLSEDGIVVIAATISKKEKKIVAGPDCQMRGFVFVKESEPLLKTISSMFIEEINDALTGPYLDLDELNKTFSERATRFIKRENGRQPYVLPIIKIID